MQREIEERARKNAEYIIATGCTVRVCADTLGASKSTVHKDVTERIQKIDADLAAEVRKVLGVNLSERHLRGGNATKHKYEMQREAGKGNRLK